MDLLRMSFPKESYYAWTLTRANTIDVGAGDVVQFGNTGGSIDDITGSGHELSFTVTENEGASPVSTIALQVIRGAGLDSAVFVDGTSNRIELIPDDAAVTGDVTESGVLSVGDTVFNWLDTDNPTVGAPQTDFADQLTRLHDEDIDELVLQLFNASP